MSAVADVIPHSPKAPRNLQIQWLRAIAALMVMLFHASVYGVVLLKNDRFLQVLDGRLGISGVSLFFAISGYLMATALRVQQPFAFLSHRVIRIYPTLLIATALYCLVEYCLHQPLRVDFAGLTLAPIGRTSKYPLRVEWTLVFEVTFYVALFFVDLLGQAKRIARIAAGWLGLLVASSLLQPDTGALMYPLQSILTVCENVAMAGGLLIPSLLRLRLPPLLLLAMGLLAWPIYTLYPMGNEGARWLFGIGATLVVAGAVGLSMRRPDFGHGVMGRAFAKFGDYSYALYLIHVPIIYTLYATVPLPFGILWALAIVATVVGAILLGRIDMALYHRLKAWLKTVRPAQLRWAMALYLLLFFASAAGPGWKLHKIAQRQRQAHELAVGLGPIASIDQASQAAIAAGFTPNPALQGHIETAAMSEAGLEINGWAVDPRGQQPALLALYQNGRLLDAGAPWFARADIQKRFGLTAKAGFSVTLPPPCDAADPIIGIVLAQDRSFAIMPESPRPDCTVK
jgi:peptidoglycan/LPS O-acetylase OafA/YrhL